MRGESPVDFAWDALHVFELSCEGKLLDRFRDKMRSLHDALQTEHS